MEMSLFKHANQNAAEIWHAVVLNGMRVDLMELNVICILMETVKTKQQQADKPKNNNG